jgi:CRP-like cAMP-binding protein/Fe-S-cluster-containing hydrogenase component 2
MARHIAELRQRQASALAQLDALAGVPIEHLGQLAAIGTMRAFIPGAVLVGERAPGQFLYFILRGTVRLHLHDRAGNSALIGYLNRGDCFGEGPLFGDQFRSASAQAETICYLLQIALSDLRPLLDSTPTIAETLRTVYHNRLVASTLGRVPLFSQLSPLARIGIADRLIRQHYARGTHIIHLGAPGDALYLIESGQVVVEVGKRAFAHLDEGDFFGEMSLLNDEPHNADVRALTPVDVLTLPADSFRELLDTQPKLIDQMQEVVEQRRQANLTNQHDLERTQQLGRALDGGVLRGRQVLVRDPVLCKEGCTICVDACSKRHGHARLRTDGLLLNGIDITDSCRQCRVGAECVEACPQDAIQWNTNGALIVTDACDGCGKCVPACPYDAIQLVPRSKRQSPFGQLWDRVRKLQAPIIPLEPAQPTHRANKCDLCHGYNDLACVSACPTGALKLVPVESLMLG